MTSYCQSQFPVLRRFSQGEPRARLPSLQLAGVRQGAAQPVSHTANVHIMASPEFPYSEEFAIGIVELRDSRQVKLSSLAVEVPLRRDAAGYFPSSEKSSYSDHRSRNRFDRCVASTFMWLIMFQKGDVDAVKFVVTLENGEAIFDRMGRMSTMNTASNESTHGITVATRHGDAQHTVREPANAAVTRAIRGGTTCAWLGARQRLAQGQDPRADRPHHRLRHR